MRFNLLLSVPTSCTCFHMKRAHPMLSQPGNISWPRNVTCSWFSRYEDFYAKYSYLSIHSHQYSLLNERSYYELIPEGFPASPTSRKTMQTVFWYWIHVRTKSTSWWILNGHFLHLGKMNILSQIVESMLESSLSIKVGSVVNLYAGSYLFI